MSNWIIKKALAHSEETHETAVESAIHYFEFLENPYFAVPIFFIILSVVYFFLKKIGVRSSVILLITVLLLFVGGVLGFLFVPPLGIVSITLGFILSGLLVFSGIKAG